MQYLLEERVHPIFVSTLSACGVVSNTFLQNCWIVSCADSGYAISSCRPNCQFQHP